jgi:N-acetyl-gamma-glutamyl-phosphate reductase
MTLPKVFVDGHVGTTGLRIRELLACRTDLELLSIGEERRKDPGARRELSNAADLVLLCLPDDAARGAVAWIENPTTRVLDASTAHRVAEGWTFGLPELTSKQRGAIRDATRVSNPGCYSTAMVLGVRPLVDEKLLPASASVTVHGLSGYSGGGRSLIERWEDPDSGLLVLPYEAPYALDRVHKHIPEMRHYSGLEEPPQFIPAVGPFRDGMRLEIPLHAATLAEGVTGKAVWEALDARYADEPFVRVLPLREPLESNELSFDPRACNSTNRLEIVVAPNPAGHVLLLVRLDNLGKGASGAAVQNLNLMLGLPETAGLSS